MIIIIIDMHQGSSAAIPFFTLVALLALWFGVSVPLTFVGAYFGFRRPSIEQPVMDQSVLQRLVLYYLTIIFPLSPLFSASKVSVS